MSSPCTQEVKIATLSANQENLMKEIWSLKTDVKNLSDKIDIKFTEMMNRIDAKLDKKADKWTELAIRWAIGIIIGIVLSAMVYNVISK